MIWNTFIGNWFLDNGNIDLIWANPLQLSSNLVKNNQVQMFLMVVYKCYEDF